MQYNVNYNVEYTNNFEYRKCIREVFNMDTVSEGKHPYWSKMDEDIDEETKDELIYDSDAMFQGLDYIYGKTQHNPLFQELYEIAAAKMISIDPNIGLAVIFSYDYFSLFHLCLADFFKNPDSFTRENINFVNMRKKIY
jgi:hypothetical protein